VPTTMTIQFRPGSAQPGLATEAGPACTLPGYTPRAARLRVCTPGLFFGARDLKTDHSTIQYLSRFGGRRHAFSPSHSLESFSVSIGGDDHGN